MDAQPRLIVQNFFGGRLPSRGSVHIEVVAEVLAKEFPKIDRKELLEGITEEVIRLDGVILLDIQ